MAGPQTENLQERYGPGRSDLPVMVGLVPTIYVFAGRGGAQVVDARNKPEHDDGTHSTAAQIRIQKRKNLIPDCATTS